MTRFQTHRLIQRQLENLTEEELRAVFGTALNIMSDAALAELASVTERYTESKVDNFLTRRNERAAQQG